MIAAALEMLAAGVIIAFAAFTLPCAVSAL